MSVVKHRLPALPALRERFIADFEKGVLLANPEYKGRRGRQTHNRPVGSVTVTGRTVVGINGRTYPIGRILWKMHTGRDPGSLYIDHINGDVTDNRIENLRAVTPGENRMNSRTHSKTGHKGIYEHINRSGEVVFRVQICRVIGTGPVGGKGSRDGRRRKTYCFGTYKTLEAAKAKYIEVIKSWGLEDMTRPKAITPIKTVELPDDPNDLKPGDNWLNDYINEAAGAA